MTLPYVFCIIQGIQGVSKIKDGYNPATWMLEVTTISQEQILGLEFSDIYKKSELYQYVNFDPLGNFIFKSDCTSYILRTVQLTKVSNTTIFT
jgi:hypothetical protein